jgi:hypothetical protein
VYVNAEGLCDIDATDRAVVEVILASARSAVITVRDHASVQVTIGESARGGLHVRDRTARGELRGDATEFHFSDVCHQESKR